MGVPKRKPSTSRQRQRRAYNSVLHDYMPRTLKDIGVDLPIRMMKVAARYGAPPDFFETINGSRRIDHYTPPTITYVDNMFEYMTRAIGARKFLDSHERFSLQAILEHCRPGRLETFKDIWRTSERMREADESLEARANGIEAERRAHRAALDAIGHGAIVFTDKTPPAGA